MPKSLVCPFCYILIPPKNSGDVGNIPCLLSIISQKVGFGGLRWRLVQIEDRALCFHIEKDKPTPTYKTASYNSVCSH